MEKIKQPLKFKHNTGVTHPEDLGRKKKKCPRQVENQHVHLMYLDTEAFFSYNYSKTAFGLFSPDSMKLMAS